MHVFFSVDWVKTKIRQLWNSYTKASKVPSSGSARKPNTKRTQWLLDRLQFLAPFVASHLTMSILDPVCFSRHLVSDHVFLPLNSCLPPLFNYGNVYNWLVESMSTLPDPLDDSDNEDDNNCVVDPHKQIKKQIP